MNGLWEVEVWADSLEREGGVAIVTDTGATLMVVPSPGPLEISRLELAQRLVKDHNAMLRLGGQWDDNQ